MVRDNEMVSGNNHKERSRISAVVLDYGEVICVRPKMETLDRMARVFGRESANFFELYIASRGPYDQGVVTAVEYWRSFSQSAGVPADEELIAKLRRWDTDMWSNVSIEMTEWLARLHAGGLKTALLSNMQHDMAAHARKNFAWLAHFDHQILSCEVRLIKPDPAIFHLSVDRLGVRPQEALLVDDREANVAAAKAIGMAAIQFQNVEQLREELKDMEFDILPRRVDLEQGA